VLDIETGEVLEDEIKWAKFSGASWENDDSGFFYQKYDEPKGELLKEVNESPKLMFHKIGTDQSEDYVVYENPDQPRWGWGINVNNSANMIAFSISDGGSDWRVWKVLDIETGEVLEDEIKWAKFSGASWENDDSGFFYQKYDEPKGELLKEVNESPKLMFHKIGTDQSEDYVVYENPDQPRWGWGINVIEDTNIKILSISEGTDERNRLYIQLNTGANFIPLIDELIGAYSFIDSKEGILWFYTTEGAPKGKIVNLEIKNNSFVWNDVIQESDNSIRSVNIVNNSFVINYLVDTFSSIKIS
jgi:prolyl oligopeptidase